MRVRRTLEFQSLPPVANVQMVQTQGAISGICLFYNATGGSINVNVQMAMATSYVGTLGLLFPSGLITLTGGQINYFILPFIPNFIELFASASGVYCQVLLDYDE